MDFMNHLWVSLNQREISCSLLEQDGLVFVRKPCRGLSHRRLPACFSSDLLLSQHEGRASDHPASRLLTAR